MLLQNCAHHINLMLLLLFLKDYGLDALAASELISSIVELYVSEVKLKVIQIVQMQRTDSF